MTKHDKIRFLALGDWGKNTTIQENVAKLLEQSPCDGVLVLGDNFYEFGVESVHDPLWQDIFLNVYKNRTVPWYPILGNHDYMRNPQAQIDYSLQDVLWRFPNRYYDNTFYWGPDPSDSVHIIAIDTFDMAPIESHTMSSFINTPKILSGMDTDAQWAWLHQTLHSSRSRYKIVMGHYPVFSHGLSHGNNKELIENLKPILDKYNVDIYLSGHDHCLDYQKINHTHYIVSGTGSMLVGSHNPVFHGHTGLCDLIFTKNHMMIRFISTDGKIIFEKCV